MEQVGEGGREFFVSFYFIEEFITSGIRTLNLEMSTIGPLEVNKS